MAGPMWQPAGTSMEIPHCASSLRALSLPARSPASRPSRRRLTACRAEVKLGDHSQAVYQELLLLLVQGECEIQVNRALIREQYDILSEVRRKRDEVDEILQLFQNKKSAAIGGARASGGGDAVAEGLQLRMQLQAAIEDQRYEEAAQIKAKMDKLSNSSSSGAGGGPARAKEKRFKLGQIVQHVKEDYRGIVFGWDDACVEGEEWRKERGLEHLAGGLEQPFYYVLATNDEAQSFVEFPTCYAPEELLVELEEEGRKEFYHPLAIAIFIGQDTDGHYIPGANLRKRYPGAPSGL